MGFINIIVGRFLSLIRYIYWSLVYGEYRTKYNLPSDFRFNGAGIIFTGNGKIDIGVSSYIGGLSTIQVSEGMGVVIGNNCSISHNVRIYTKTDIADSDFSIKPVPTKCGNVVLGSYSWIGANVFINPGVSIGDNSVVGANSVVTKNIPCNEIWGGVPARLIKKKTFSFGK